MMEIQDKLDVVIPFVDCTDKYWISSYCKATKCYSYPKERFRDWGTLRYWFRGIAKYMPFVRNVVLILASESQIPSWLNTENVRIVYHREFIPEQFLPTFSSSAIESFLYNISGLSERFIYFNDDMFVINPVDLDDFFVGMTPKMQFNFHDTYNHASIFRRNCRNCLDMITDAMHLDRYPINKLFLSNHSVACLLTKTLEAVKLLCGDKIPATVTKTRTPKNVHKHIYEYYQYYTEKSDIEYTLKFHYFELSDNLSAIRNVFKEDNLQLICLNDSDKIKHYTQTREELLAIFEEKFPHKCKYEV